MNKQARFIGFTTATLLIFIFTLVSPITALADDGTPPPEGTPATETSDSSGGTPDDSSPSAEETPTAEAVDAPTEAAGDPAPTEEVTVPEVLQQAPEGTELVVLDEQGEPLPLASDEAAQILVSSDPMWCPDGQTPGSDMDDSVQDCTDPFSKFGTTTDGSGGLLEELSENQSTYSGNGTIYVADGYDSSTAGGGEGYSINFYSSDYSLSDLTIQGGWDFIGNTVTGTSTFNGSSLYFEWDYKVTLKDIEVHDALYEGVIIYSGDDVALDNVSVDNSALDDGWDGIDIYTSGDVSMTDVNSNNNDYGNGATVFGETVHIQNSHFNGNGEFGLIASDASPATITLNNVTANENGFAGALLLSAGNIEVSDSQFNNNGYAEGCEGEFCGCEGECECYDLFSCLFGIGLPSGLGLMAVNGGLFDLDLESGSNITLNNVTADANALDGALLISSGDIAVTGSQFNDNGSQAELYCNEGSCYSDPFSGTGLGAFAFPYEQGVIPQITLNQVVANNNFGSGAFLLGDDIVVMNSAFNDNGRFPLGYEEYQGYDLWADGLLAGDILFSSVTIQCSQANNNAGYGFEIVTGDVTLAGANASGNGFDGFFIDADTVNTFDTDCAEDGGGGPHTPPVVIPVTGGEGFLIDCANPEDFIALLDNGDRALFDLLCGYDGVLTESPLDVLPHALPEGYQYLAGMNIAVLDGGSSLDPLPEGASVTPSFHVTDPDAEYAILYWNGTEWIEVEGHMTDDGFFEAQVDFTGIFVLVSK